MLAESRPSGSTRASFMLSGNIVSEDIALSRSRGPQSPGHSNIGQGPASAPSTDSTSSSSCPMSASSSSTLESSLASSVNEFTTSISYTPAGVPVISVGYLSEARDLDALALELDSYASTKYEQAVHAPAAYSISEGHTLFKNAEKGDMPTFSSNYRPRPNSYPHASSGRSKAASDLRGESTARSGDCRLCTTIPLHQEYIVAAAGGKEVAVLLDSKSGRAKKSSKALPTLAQALSTFNFLQPPGLDAGEIGSISGKSHSIQSSPRSSTSWSPPSISQDDTSSGETCERPKPQPACNSYPHQEPAPHPTSRPEWQRSSTSSRTEQKLSDDAHIHPQGACGCWSQDPAAFIGASSEAKGGLQEVCHRAPKVRFVGDHLQQGV